VPEVGEFVSLCVQFRNVMLPHISLHILQLGRVMVFGDVIHVTWCMGFGVGEENVASSYLIAL
jgi:hypothetical protein